MSKKNKEKMPKGGSIRVVELVPGFFVSVYKSTIDDVLVVEFEGSPPGDDVCEDMRLYVNDKFAAEFVDTQDPRYGKSASKRKRMAIVDIKLTLREAERSFREDPTIATATAYRVVARRYRNDDLIDEASLFEVITETAAYTR